MKPLLRTILIALAAVIAAAAPTQSSLDGLPEIAQSSDVSVLGTQQTTIVGQPTFEPVEQFDDVNDDDDPTEATISTSQLGEGAVINLQRPGGRREIGIAIPDGMVLTDYSATLSVPGAVHEAILSIYHEGEVVHEAIVAGATTRQIHVTFEELIATDTALEFVVEEHVGGSCTSTVLEPNLMTITDSQFALERIDDEPVTIAGFFPPVMTDMIIVTEPEPGASVSGAVYNIAAAMARRYPTIPRFSISNDISNPPLGSGAFSRTIVLQSSDDPGIQLEHSDGGAFLTVSGPPGVLEQLASMLSEPEMELVANQAAEADLAEVNNTDEDLLARRTLEDVGVRRLVASGSRVVQIPIVLPQAAFGEPVSEIQVRIGGLSVASDVVNDKPALSLWINDNLQESIVPDETGRFDIDFVLEGAQLKRDNVIIIRSELALECGQELPTHELQIDAGSWVDAAPGQSLPPSLDRFPQVGIQELSVASGSTPSEVETALTMVAALQASSPIDMNITAVTGSQLANGDTPGLVVTNGHGSVASEWETELRTVRTEDVELVAESPPDDLAFVSSSQAEDGADVLVVFSPPNPIVVASFNKHVLESGWSTFSGNVVGVNLDAEVIASDVVDTPQQTELPSLQDPDAPIVTRFGLGVLAVLLLAVALGVGRTVFRAVGRLR